MWVDPETDLPVEFGYQGVNESIYTHRFFDFRWNVELDAKLFEPTPPAGFDDITPPSDERTIDQIAEALRLYAGAGRRALSAHEDFRCGGHPC